MMMVMVIILDGDECYTQQWPHESKHPAMTLPILSVIHNGRCDITQILSNDTLSPNPFLEYIL